MVKVKNKTITLTDDEISILNFIIDKQIVNDKKLSKNNTSNDLEKDIQEFCLLSDKINS